jgi:hypothetical protein
LTYSDPSGHDAVIITANGAASGFGHTSAIYQNASGDWYYTYWGDKTVLSMKVGSDVMSSLANFNTWLDASADDKSTHEYTSSTYIEGDFTKSLEYFNGLKKTYDENDNNGDTTGYRLLYNNCLQQQLIALKKGTTNDGTPISDFLTYTADKYVTQPNAAEEAFRNEFYNNAFTRSKYTDQLKSKLSALERNAWTRFWNSGTISNIKSLLSDPKN